MGCGVAEAALNAQASCQAFSWACWPAVSNPALHLPKHFLSQKAQPLRHASSPLLQLVVGAPASSHTGLQCMRISFVFFLSCAFALFSNTEIGFSPDYKNKLWPVYKFQTVQKGLRRK